MTSLQFNKLIEDRIFEFYKAFTDVEILFLNKEEDYFHPGEYGTYREKLIINFIKNIIPANFGIGGGFIINNENKLSTQCDVVIYDKVNTPLLQERLTNFYPIETCVAVGEVKSTLSTKELKEALCKLAKHKKLRNSDNGSTLIKRGTPRKIPNLLNVLENILDDSDKQFLDQKYRQKYRSDKEFLNWLYEHKCTHYNKVKKLQIKDIINNITDKNWTVYDTKLHNLDNITTFLICEKIDLKEKGLKDLPNLIRKWYEEEHIDSAYRHNIILSLEDGVILYHDLDEKQVLAQSIKDGISLENAYVKAYNPMPLILNQVIKSVNKIKGNIKRSKRVASIDQTQKDLYNKLITDILNLDYMKSLNLLPQFKKLAQITLKALIEEIITSSELNIESERQELITHFYKWLESYIIAIDTELLSRSTEHIKIFSHYIWLNIVDTTILYPDMSLYLNPIEYNKLEIKKEI